MMRKPRPASRSRGKVLQPRTLELEITLLGARGDGVAMHQDLPVFVPGTVVGDRVLAEIEGRRGDGLAAKTLRVLQAGPTRVTPACPYFGRCGGCALQQLEMGAYRTWKRGLLVETLDRIGVGEELVAPLEMVAPGSRRRAAFAFTRHRADVALGFHAKASHQMVNIDQCLLLDGRLLTVLPALRELLAATVADGADGDVTATLTENGLDLLIDAEARLDLFDRERLAAFAEKADLARLSWRRPGESLIEPVAHRRPAVVRFGKVVVTLPPGGFLQPSLEGERILSGLVQDAIGAVGPVADLYAGSGSFTFPLAEKTQVHAVEGDALALAALKAAADAAGAKVSAECRDLAQRPLLAGELKRFQAVVFDPPRAGAGAQAEQLALAGPSLVVAVSCNPATLARDARLLVDGGYRLVKATPVDQFPFTAHLEAVAVFQR